MSRLKHTHIHCCLVIFWYTIKDVDLNVYVRLLDQVSTDRLNLRDLD